MSDNRSFHYTYSAEAQREVKAILRKYGLKEPKNESAPAVLEALRQIDRSTARPGRIIGLIAGILGTLTMGTGMSMCMVGGQELFFPGIGVGLLGIALIAVAYPLSKAVTQRQKVKNAPKIEALLGIDKES